MKEQDYWHSIDEIEIDYDAIPTLAKNLPSIFEQHPDINTNAYLNWRMDFCGTRRRRLVIVGQAYFDTAYYLLQQCLDDNLDKKADVWIFPILFHVVHGIEVYLKAINVSYNVALHRDNTEIEGSHDIKQLWSVARKLVLAFKTEYPSGTADQLWNAVKVVGKFIDNIYDKTDDMTFARYPMDRDNNGQFYIEKMGNTVVNMEELHKQLPVVFHMLDYIFDMPEMFIDDNNMVNYY